MTGSRNRIPTLTPHLARAIGIRMTEVLCQCIRYQKDAEIETGTRRAIRDDLQKVAREMPPGIRRVAAMLSALMPYHKRLVVGIEP